MYRIYGINLVFIFRLDLWVIKKKVSMYVQTIANKLSIRFVNRFKPICNPDSGVTLNQAKQLLNQSSRNKTLIKISQDEAVMSLTLLQARNCKVLKALEKKERYELCKIVKPMAPLRAQRT